MKPKSPSPLPVLLIFVFLAILAVWVGVAVGTGDALWFLPSFAHDAAALDLYWDGAIVRLEPGSEGYAQLNAALREDLARVRAYPNTVGLSDSSLDSLRSSGRLLEAYYAEPARVHSRYNFGASTVFYIPLSEEHASRRRVFNAGRGAPVELASNDHILAAAEAVAAQSGLGGP